MALVKWAETSAGVGAGAARSTVPSKFFGLSFMSSFLSECLMPLNALQIIPLNVLLFAVA